MQVNRGKQTMPVNVVKTKQDELDWEKAKAAVEKELGGKLDPKHMPLVMHIFETIKKSHQDQSQPSALGQNQDPSQQPSPEDNADAAKSLLMGGMAKGKKKPMGKPPMVQDSDNDGY